MTTAQHTPSIVLTEQETLVLRSFSTLDGIETVNGCAALFESITQIPETNPPLFSVPAEFSRTGNAITALALRAEFDYILGLTASFSTESAIERLHDPEYGPDIRISLLTKFVDVSREHGVDQPVNRGF